MQVGLELMSLDFHLVCVIHLVTFCCLINLINPKLEEKINLIPMSCLCTKENTSYKENCHESKSNIMLENSLCLGGCNYSLLAKQALLNLRFPNSGLKIAPWLVDI